MRKQILWVGILLICILIAGCGGGGGGNSHVVPVPDDKSVFVLNNGVEVDTTSFSGKKIYTLITSIPESGKLEGNEAVNLPEYKFFLISAAIRNMDSLMSPELSGKVKESRLASQTVLGSEQVEKDIFMRNRENEILSRRLKQLSKNGPTIKPGTKWENAHVNGTVVDLTCRYESDHAYIFVDQRNITQMESWVEGYGKAFDVIYDMVRGKFGTENDVDNNGKIIIVFSQELAADCWDILMQWINIHRLILITPTREISSISQQPLLFRENMLKRPWLMNYSI